MALITVAETKSILQLDGSYDTVLGVLVPLVCKEVVKFTNNRFANRDVYVENTSFSFSNSTSKITDSQSQFLASYFNSSVNDFIVRGSLYNDGLFESQTVTANEITINTTTMTKTLVDEAEGELIRIQRVDFPAELKLPTARWLNYLIRTDNLKGVKSESVLSYSVNYITDMPENVRKEFNLHRKVKWK